MCRIVFLAGEHALCDAKALSEFFDGGAHERTFVQLTDAQAFRFMERSAAFVTVARTTAPECIVILTAYI